MTSSSSRPFDILVYGATGYTGRRIAKYICDTYTGTIKLAISGRSPSKLHVLASDLHLPSTHVFPAGVDDDDGLVHTLRQARVVLACAGPYRQEVGSAILHAAIRAQTDYLDLCGEPQFFDDMLVRFDASAKEKKVLVVSACAFDCVPAELLYTLLTNHDTAVKGVEIVHTFQNIKCANATTYHAAVDGFHAAVSGELRQSRNAVRNKYPPPSSSSSSESKADPTKTKKGPGGGLWPVYHKEAGMHVMKFMGADAAAILASRRYLQISNPSSSSSTTQPPITIRVLFGVSDKYTAYRVLAYGGIFSMLARYRWGCNLLHRYPEFFSNNMFRSHDGGRPIIDDEDEDSSDASFITHAYGYDVDTNTNQEIVKVRAKCSGPEPAYIATSKIIVALALTLLQHRELLPFDGGVMLPGALFGKCDEAYRLLRKEGISFDVIVEDEDAEREEEAERNGSAFDKEI